MDTLNIMPGRPLCPESVYYLNLAFPAIPISPLSVDSDHDIEFELLPLLRMYKSGRVERLWGSTVVPASLDPATGVTSKDVVINPATMVSARPYLPTLSDTPPKKLPILVYFHGGGFIVGSSSSPEYHNYLNPLAAKASVLIISVDYHRAPEHPLPNAYDDSLAALNWVITHSTGCGPEPWLVEHGDFTQLFLAGDSAGANIAHNVAMSTGAGANIEGVALVHPYFWGSERLGAETTEQPEKGFVETVWRVACPETEGMDDPLINPFAAGARSLEGLGCRRVVVFVAGKDILRGRGRWYYEGLVGCGWGGKAALLEDEGVGHVFHLSDSECEKAVAKMKRMLSFLRGD